MTNETWSYTAEFRARGVRLFKENRDDNAAYEAIAPQLGCSPDSLRARCRQADRHAGERTGPTGDEKARLKALEREVREFRRANEIFKKASAYFAPPIGDCGAITCRAAGRSPAAGSSDDRVYRRAPGRFRCRADWHGPADRAIYMSTLGKRSTMIPTWRPIGRSGMYRTRPISSAPMNGSRCRYGARKSGMLCGGKAGTSRAAQWSVS